jgi:Flp pilus assembly protein TadD
MLAALDENEEAELRFVQTLAIEKDHPHALAALGLSRAAQGDVAEALKHLRRAQRLRPADARIAFYLAQAATTATAAGIDVGLCIEMPPIECAEQAAAIDHLAATIEQEPEFVDAFLTLEPSEVDESVLGLLAQTLAKATERNPQHAALHYLQGRVLERLGRAQEAITAAERAVDIDPRHVQALILLAHLYRQTDRFADARRRLEETVMLGAEYADTYYLLGNLYRDDGQLQRARWAYEQALRLNRRYTAAQQALAALAA